MPYCHLDQGVIINGIRSEKYPDNKCFGIIITASCDVANAKVNKLYYIVGVDAEVWFSSSYGFYLSYIKSKENKISSKIKQYGLNVNNLLTFELEDATKVIEEYVKIEKEKNEILKQISEYFEYKNANEIQRKEIIKKNPKTAYNKLKEINSSKVEHYYFLPKAGYTNNKILDQGIIIDFQEIGILNFQVAKIIESTGIDYKHLSKFEPKDRTNYTESFWLNSDDDFVICESNILSPWREHLMQRFSHSFCRIGLDGPTDNDLIKFRERLAGE